MRSGARGCVGVFHGAGLLALLTLALAPGRPAAAQPVGTAFTYQGQLNDAGSPANAPYDFEFRLFDSPAATNQVGPVVTVGDVAVANGLFTVSLDFGAVFNGNKRWLEIRVRPGPSAGGYTILSPLQELSPSPNAVSVPWTGLTAVPAGFADGIDNDSGGDITGVTAGTGLTGGGTTGPVTLNVNFAGSGAATTASRTDHDHFGQVWAPAAAPAADGLTINTNNAASGRAAFTGIHSAASSQGYGLWGRSTSTAGVGVHGEAPAASGSTMGVHGVSASTGGFGLYGQATATAGPASGVYGTTSSTYGNGVWGNASATSGPATGVAGVSASTAGYGVYGRASGITGTNYGVYGESLSVLSGYGVYGVSVSQSGAGVFGSTSVTNGTGVIGFSSATNGTGVIGFSSATSGTGIYGFAFLGLAGKFDGNVAIIGNLSKSSGSFKIDHPLDPENKYLYHSFVESPDMMNVYNGNVVLDGRGEAVVELPEWFEALNQDFRYQLTAIGAPGPGLHVAAKVQGNRFRIGGGSPGLEVSWQVTGIRHDAYAEKHRIQVEVDKSKEERGTYLHPEEHGAPKEKGREYKLGPKPPSLPAAPESVPSS